MKQRLLELLVCPNCQALFDLEILQAEKSSFPGLKIEENRCRNYCAFEKGSLTPLKTFSEPRPCEECYTIEIETGALSCRGCRRIYPIVGGIPRFLPDSAEEYSDKLHGFIEQKKKGGTNSISRDRAEFKRVHSVVRSGFSREWLLYTRLENDEENTYFLLRWIGRDKVFFRDKLTLDAGCGGGRYDRLAAMFGAEIIGIDLGEGVEQARRLNKEFPFTHFLQGNLMQPPLARGAFDFVFTVGVLHHTPVPRDAFMSISALVKPGGDLSVWLYPRDWLTTPIISPKLPRFEFFNKIFRNVTLQLPHWYMDFLARVMSVFPLIPGSEKIQQLASIHPLRNVRIQQNFNWYTPPYQSFHTNEEVSGWFRDAGYTEITINQPLPVSVSGKNPIKK